MKQKIQSLLENINHGLIDRGEAVKLALLATIASEHILLVGPPGTGKSMIARRIANCFTDPTKCGGDAYFEYLLTKFSTPEEIFGPLSISALKADHFRRNTAGYLPTVKIAFLDEIFKASSSILNALLTILNERVYHNGTERQQVPLQALIAASNELPVGQDELSALYDRFLVRCFVDYVSSDHLSRLFEQHTLPDLGGQIGEAELHAIREAASAVMLPPSVQEAIQAIWLEHREIFKEDRREQLSDRRLKKLIQLLRVAAATNDRSNVDLSDLVLLKYCLWNHPDNAATVQKLVLGIVHRYSMSMPSSGQEEAYPGSTNTRTKVHKPGKNVVKGYAGSGTLDDPLLIGNADELLGLARAEVGMRGYHFRQTADIDCSALSSWCAIPFNGHYDGGGFNLVGRTNFMEEDDALFDTIGPNSSLSRLNINYFVLANQADSAAIYQCRSNRRIIGGDAKSCYIQACFTRDSLIGGEAVACTISHCQTGSFLIHRDRFSHSYARQCTISDCIVVLNYSGSDRETRGGLVEYLTDNSHVDRCLVTGKCNYKGSDYFYFKGIAYECQSSQIRNCAVGPLERSSSDVKIDPRIASVSNGGTLKNNAAIDSVQSCASTNEPDGPNGRTVPAANFNQYFFEHTLGWDFAEIWQWDPQTNLPSLRDIGPNAQNLPPSQSKRTAASVDMLTQQLHANMWL